MLNFRDLPIGVFMMLVCFVRFDVHVHRWFQRCRALRGNCLRFLFLFFREAATFSALTLDTMRFREL